MKALLGGLLMAIGILIAGASGLCSAALFVSDLGSTAQMLPLVLLFGGMPFLLGIGLTFGGRALIRAARANTAIEDDTFR
ncbi:hypothetical protein MTR62_19850 [Novosphingobium sp. 1949]|uniref:Uncharacterized protein n=1 Tax=Novosphingobium organovorum TaxID=2930092 RepID=A0ABT0BJC6_9SPHN|nr:hypothetical protein [Novosphingobium organovorum]MCJ2184921.1 hypothetical protein [Novosphingobium organovorum]